MTFRRFVPSALPAGALLLGMVLLASPPTVRATDPPPGDPPPDPPPTLSLLLEPAFNPAAPLLGRVQLRDATGAVLHQWTSPQPNDLFGLSAIITPDVNGDGIADVAIAIPNAFDDIAAARVGIVVIKSGADGSTLSTISGTPLERFGLALFGAAGAEPGVSPILTVLVEALDPITNAPSGSFTFQSFDAFSGAFIAEAVRAPSGFTAQAAEDSLAIYIRAGGPADLDASGSVTPIDLSILADNYGTAIDPITGQLLQQNPTLAATPTGDTNGDGVVDAGDLNTVISNLGQQLDPNHVPIDETLTEAEAIVVEAGFRQAVPMSVECRPCNGCPPERCLRRLDPFEELDEDGPDFDDGGDGTGPPDDGDGPGGGGGPLPQDGDSDEDGIINKEDCDSVYFTGDPASDVRCQDDDNDGIKNQDEFTYMLPGSSECCPIRIPVGGCYPYAGPPENPTPIGILSISPPSVAVFRLGSELRTSLEGHEWVNAFVVAVGPGIATVTYTSLDSPCRMKGRIKVGGAIRLEYDGPPTFDPTSNEPNSQAIPATGPPEWSFPEIGGGPFPEGGRGRVSPEVAAAALAKPDVASNARIVVTNADGDPFPSQQLLLLSRDGLYSFQRGTTGTFETAQSLSTDWDGVASFKIRADDEIARAQALDGSSIPEEYSIAVGHIEVLTGDLLEDYRAHTISDVVLADIIADEEVPFDTVRALGHGVQMQITAGTAFRFDPDLPDWYAPPIVLSFGAYNKIHYWFAHHIFTGESLDFGESDLPEDQLFTVGLYQDQGVGVEPVDIEFSVDRLGLLNAYDGVPDRIDRFESALGSISSLDASLLDFRLPDDLEFPGDPQDAITPEGVLAVLAIGTGEIVLGFVPGGDLVDLVREFYGVVWNDEDANWWVVGASGFGLVSDGTYFLPGVGAGLGATGNVVVLLVKKIAKLDDVPQLKGFLKRASDTAGSFQKFVSALATYMGRVYDRLPSMPTQAEKAVACVNSVGTKIAKIVTAPIGVPIQKGADAWVFLMTKAHRALSDNACEGVASIAARQGDEALDELGSLRTMIRGTLNGSEELADDAFEAITEAVGKAYRNIGATADNRVADALAAARHPFKTSNYEQLLGSHIGPGKAIKSREEFDALRFMRAEDLRPEQVVAIKAIRASMGAITGTTPVRKFLTIGDADGYLGGLSPEFGGFFARADDVQSMIGAPRQQVMDALRLPEGSYTGGYAVLEIDSPNFEMVSKVGAPKSAAYWDGGSDHLVLEPQPNTGNGIIGSLDGCTRAEYHFGKVNGLGTGENVRVKFPVGTRLKKFANSGTSLGHWRFDGLDGNNLPIWTPQP